MELGLDAYLQARCPELRRCGLGAPLPSSELDFLCESFLRTHGPVVDANHLRRAYCATLRLTPLLLTLGRLSAAAQSVRRRHDRPTPRSASITRGGGGAGIGEGKLAVVRSFVAQVSPRPWLVRAVRRCTRHFAESFLAHQRSALCHLENYDLDTGLPEIAPGLMPVRLL